MAAATSHFYGSICSRCIQHCVPKPLQDRQILVTCYLVYNLFSGNFLDFFIIGKCPSTNKSLLFFLFLLSFLGILLFILLYSYNYTWASMMLYKQESKQLRAGTNTEQAEGHGKPSHDSWQELSLLILTEPSSVLVSFLMLKGRIKCFAGDPINRL